jgi:hypothetical protein
MVKSDHSWVNERSPGKYRETIRLEKLVTWGGKMESMSVFILQYHFGASGFPSGPSGPFSEQ